MDRAGTPSAPAATDRAADRRIEHIRTERSFRLAKNGATLRRSRAFVSQSRVPVRSQPRRSGLRNRWGSDPRWATERWKEELSPNLERYCASSISFGIEPALRQATPK